MSIRDTVVEKAIWEADRGSWKPTAEEMIAFFEQSGLAPPNWNDLDKFETDTSNVRVNGKSTAWCGIFACYVLKRWGGLNVKWKYYTGLVGKTALKIVYDYRFMRPGDVAVIRNKVNKHGDYLHHHFIVTAIDYGSNHLEAVEGNSTGNKIVWNRNRQIQQGQKEQNFLKRPYCYYQLLA